LAPTTTKKGGGSRGKKGCENENYDSSSTSIIGKKRRILRGEMCAFRKRREKWGSYGEPPIPQKKKMSRSRRGGGGFAKRNGCGKEQL